MANILVVGGTGTVGSAVVERLAGGKEGVAVMSRSPQKAGAQAQGVRRVVGDLDRPDTLPPAFKGVERLVLITPVSETEEKQGKAAVEAAKAAGVGRIVFMSVHNVEKCPEAPHFASKVEVEKAIVATGIPHVVVMPNNFFQNDYWYKDVILGYGIYPQPFGGVGLSRVDTRDIADAIAAAVTNDRHRGRYPLVGPDVLTGEATAAAWSKHVGREVRYGGDDLEAWEKEARKGLPGWAVDDFKIMYAFFQREGLEATPADLARQKELLGREPRRFDDFAGETAKQWRP